MLVSLGLPSASAATVSTSGRVTSVKPVPKSDSVAKPPVKDTEPDAPLAPAVAPLPAGMQPVTMMMMPNIYHSPIRDPLFTVPVEVQQVRRAAAFPTVRALPIDPNAARAAAAFPKFIPRRNSTPLALRLLPSLRSEEEQTVLARITFWAPQECPFKWESAAPGPDGHLQLTAWTSAAVDPDIIPYGSAIRVPGIDQVMYAHDRGQAVVDRTAAIKSAHNEAEREALVIDVCVANPQERAYYQANFPEYVYASWTPPAGMTDRPGAFFRRGAVLRSLGVQDLLPPEELPVTAPSMDDARPDALPKPSAPEGSDAVVVQFAALTAPEPPLVLPDAVGSRSDTASSVTISNLALIAEPSRLGSAKNGAPKLAAAPPVSEKEKVKAAKDEKKKIAKNGKAKQPVAEAKKPAEPTPEIVTVTRPTDAKGDVASTGTPSSPTEPVAVPTTRPSGRLTIGAPATPSAPALISASPSETIAPSTPAAPAPVAP